MASSKKIIFLLSPAKSLNFAAHSFSKLPHSHPCFLKNTDTLLKELKQLSKGSLKTLLGVSDHLATLNHDRYRSFKLSKTASSAKPTEDEFKQCILAYNGAAYDGLDATSMSKEDLIYCNDHLRILSGLYGLVKPLDLIQPYRLDFGKKLKTEGNNNLYQFWGDQVAKAVDAEKAIVVNCASQEYFKGCGPSLKSKVVHCEFKDGGRIISVFAKRARGMMVRYATLNRCKTVEDLKKFDLEGYKYDAKASSETQLVFSRASKPPTKRSASTSTSARKKAKK